MQAGRITPLGLQADRDRAHLEQQHEHDLEALALAADVIALQAGVILRQARWLIELADLVTRLRREQTALIVQARRDRAA